jgi:hypothetical protein
MVFEFTFWQLVGGFAGIAFLAGAISVGLVRLVRWLQSGEQGYPGEREMEEALLPFIIQGILAAYKISEGAVDQFKQRLHGVDKAEIAERVYDLLPDQISVGKVVIPIGWIKQVVPEERFAELVQLAFEEGMGAFEGLWELYRDQLGDLVSTQAQR